MIAKLFVVATQVAGVETSGREHDAILYDLASESQTRIDIRQAGSPVCSKSASCGGAACIVKLTRLSPNLTHSLGSVSCAGIAYEASHHCSAHACAPCGHYQDGLCFSSTGGLLLDKPTLQDLQLPCCMQPYER